MLVCGQTKNIINIMKVQDCPSHCLTFALLVTKWLMAQQWTVIAATGSPPGALPRTFVGLRVYK